MTVFETAPLVLHLFVMLVLSVYSSHAYVMVYLYQRNGRRISPVPNAPETWPTVTVQLPLYNEKYVVARLLDAVCHLDYPAESLEVQVLDDSTDETQQMTRDLVRQWQSRGLDITYLHRTDRTGFKAGALKEGLAVAKGEYLALFDADFVPPADFLKNIIPRFDTPDIGAVQARWGHLNDQSNQLTRSLAIGLDAHFAIEHTARNSSGLFINFNGTAGVWRKDTIVDAGNWQADTLTEDLDLSYRAQMRGWRFLYADDVVCPAEIPADVRGLKTQQYRWTKGAIQTARKVLPQLWRRSDLDLKVKLEGTIHLTHNIVFPVMLTLSLLSGPMLLLQENVPASRQYFVWASTFLVWSLSYPLFYAEAQRRIYPNWRRRLLHLPGLMACAIGLSVINTRAVLSGLMNRTSPFVRTPKYNLDNRGSTESGHKHFGRIYRTQVDITALAELLLAGYLVVAGAYGVSHGQMNILPLLFLPAWGFAWIGWQSLRGSLGFSSTVGLSALIGALLFLPALVGAQSGLLNTTASFKGPRELPLCEDSGSPAVCFGFQGTDTDGWLCPEWLAMTKRYVPCVVDLASIPGESGGQALRLNWDWSDDTWCATGVALSGPMDLEPFAWLTADIQLSKSWSGRSLAARFIILAGKDHTWYQARDLVELEAGSWVSLRAPLGEALMSEGLFDYWGDLTSSLVADQFQVQAIMVRLEGTAVAGGSDAGSGEELVLLDNVKLTP